MKAIMSILREHRWRRMVLKARALIGRAPLAVGIDWGSRMIKTVALQAGHNGLTLKDFSLHPVVEKSGQNEPSDAVLVQAIRKKITDPLSTIGTSLSGPSVFVKNITLPVMTEEDLRDHLALELDRYIALDVQDVFWDVYHRNPFPGGMIDQQDHFLVVAKKECVDRQMDTFSQWGTTIRFVDVDAFALINLVTYTYGKEGTWLLAHIGPTGIVMVVIAQGEPAYIRKLTYEVEWYGDLLDQVLLPQTALESKKELGVSETLLLEQFFQKTREQICETLEFFSDLSTTVIDKGILLSGGYAVAPELVTTLAHSFEMPVHLMEPFQSIMIPPAIQQDPVFQQTAPLMNVAVGVAMRGALSHD